MTEKFSRHVNEQFRWTEALLSRLRENLRNARHFKVTQAEYLAKREEIFASEKRLTSNSIAHVRGYMRALDYEDLMAKIHVRRIIGRPETASSAKWDDMTEELREACREHRTESCLAWEITWVDDVLTVCEWGPWGRE